MNEYRWRDLAVGQSAQFDITLTPEMFAGFAAMSGDENPLHLDEDFARASGFPGRVAFGLLVSSFYSQLVGMHLPGKWALLHGLDLEFKAPAYAGDTLTVSGEVAFLTEAYRRAELKARIRNQAGTLISRATIRAGVHGD